MQITFKGHQFEVTPALKEFTTEKFDRLYRHFDRISNINVTFWLEKLENIAEATIHVPGNAIHASSKAADMYSAVDELIDKLDRQLKKHKEKEDIHS
jgi:putative sigma-54 modulation protein